MKSYEILGIDVGNAFTKNSSGLIFPSKITLAEPLMKTKSLVMDKKTYFIGEGELDTTYRKIDKENYLQFLFSSMALSSECVNNFIVLGLPLSQYKEDKTELVNKILCNRDKVVLVDGIEKHLVIQDVEVFPEGIVTLEDDFEVILIDIGGRTTDTALVINEGGKRRIINPLSLPEGTINVLSTFVERINSKYSLDLKLSDGERILRNGLLLDGKVVNIDFAKSVVEELAESIITRLQVTYSLRTNYISLTGGGARMTYSSFKDRLGDAVSIQKNNMFANAFAYKELGMSIWR